jgi:hypothetical protein
VDELKGLVPTQLRLLSSGTIEKIDESEGCSFTAWPVSRNADYCYLLGEVLWLLSETKRIVAVAASAK